MKRVVVALILLAGGLFLATPGPEEVCQGMVDLFQEESEAAMRGPGLMNKVGGAVGAGLAGAFGKVFLLACEPALETMKEDSFLQYAPFAWCARGSETLEELESCALPEELKLLPSSQRP